MYKTIRNRKSVPALYEEKLVSRGVITSQEAAEDRLSRQTQLEERLKAAQSIQPRSDMLQGKWSNMVWPRSSDALHDPDTGVEISRLKDIAIGSVTLPPSFVSHPRLKRHITARENSLTSAVDWATGEALAFGTLMQDGFDVRLSGEDVGRGTFSHRHAMFVDQNDDSCVIPLNEHLDASLGRLEVANSSLTEMAVVGFEVGMSWGNPNLLPLWEAQFGDFFNGAQSIIDTYVVGAQAKWLRQSAITLLLPHGYDEPGPEHSSCRIERFLQMSDDSETTYRNGDTCLSLANPSTPAQFFHVLRRQMLRNYRRPLIIPSPKVLLRLPAARSRLEDMATGTRFQPVLDSPDNHTSSSRVILCSGKHYYTLLEALKSNGQRDNIALIRVEELSPFPREELLQVLNRYTHFNSIVWAQEEPANMGPWTFVQNRVQDVLRKMGSSCMLRYAGRDAQAATATAVAAWHKGEKESIVQRALG